MNHNSFVSKLFKKFSFLAIGLDKTFQRGDEPTYGKYYKIVPMYNDKQGNFEGCWTITGREKWPIFAQTIIPNITWFKVIQVDMPQMDSNATYIPPPPQYVANSSMSWYISG